MHSVLDERVPSFNFVVFVELSLGSEHTMLAKPDGTVWAAGVNTFGQLGTDSRKSITISNFVKVMCGDAKAVAAGDGHSMVLEQDGSVWSTGMNKRGQLGDGSNTDRHVFVQAISSYAKAVAAGAEHSLVVMRDGSVCATGYNLHGQLGDGSTTDRNRFFQVISGGAEAVAAGSGHSMMLKQDGSVWGTGENEYGQLGDGSVCPKSSFIQVILSGG